MNSRSFQGWCLRVDKKRWNRHFADHNSYGLSVSEISALFHKSKREGWTAESYWRWSIAAEHTNPEVSQALERIARMRRCFP